MNLPSSIDTTQDPDGQKFIRELFARHPSPVELVLPYRFDDPGTRSLADACTRTQFGGSLWNMDSPWIMSVVVALGGNVLLVLLAWLISVLTPTHFAQGAGFAVLSAILLLVGMPAIYAALVVANLWLGYGKRWWLRLLGPTHVGITDLGFKLYVRGKLFYNYPNLALWTDIKKVHVSTDPVFGCATIEFTYKNSYYQRRIALPLIGFANDTDVKQFLQHLEKYVPRQAQCGSFLRVVSDDCRRGLAEYRFARPQENFLAALADQTEQAKAQSDSNVDQ